MKSEPTPQHLWLRQLIGEWAWTSACETAPGAVAEYTGTEIVRPMGDLWVVAEMAGQYGEGETFGSRTQLGFDTRIGRFVGSWIGTPMTHMYVYDGELDADERALRLFCEGPGFEDPAVLAPYCDVITIESETTRSLTSRLRTDDGAWQDFMRTEYTRTG